MKYLKKLFFISVYLVLFVSCIKAQNVETEKQNDVFEELEISKTVNQKPGVWKKDYAADEFGDNTNEIIYTQLLTNCEGSIGMLGNLQCAVIVNIPELSKRPSGPDFNTVIILGFGTDTNRIVLSAKAFANDMFSMKGESKGSLHIKDSTGKINNFIANPGYKSSEFSIIPRNEYLVVTDNIDGGISFLELLRQKGEYKAILKLWGEFTLRFDFNGSMP